MNPIKETTNEPFNITEDNFEKTITKGIVIRNFKGFLGAIHFLNNIKWGFRTSQLDKAIYLVEYNLPRNTNKETDLILAIHEAIDKNE